MKITGISKSFRIATAASMPELPSASWMSVRMMSGFCSFAILIASSRVVAMPVRSDIEIVQDRDCRIDARAAVGKLDVGEDDVRLLLFRHLDRVVARGGDAGPI